MRNWRIGQDVRTCAHHVSVHDTRKVRTPNRKGVWKVERDSEVEEEEHQSEIGRVNLPTNNKVSLPLSSSASS